jgi:hypothetical protein
MKDPRNNTDKYLRPDEPFTQEELTDALNRLLFREAEAGRRAELNRAIADYEYATGR